MLLVVISHLVEKIDGFREEEIGVDEYDLDLVQQTSLRDGVEDDAISRDQCGGEKRVLLLLRVDWLQVQPSSVNISCRHQSSLWFTIVVGTGRVSTGRDWLSMGHCPL